MICVMPARASRSGAREKGSARYFPGAAAQGWKAAAFSRYSSGCAEAMNVSYTSSPTANARGWMAGPRKAVSVQSAPAATATSAAVRCANSAACTVADQYGGAISASDYACHMWLSGHTGICIRRAILIQRSLCADDLDMMDLFQPCGTRASESGQARAVLGHALRIIAGVKSEI